MTLSDKRESKVGSNLDWYSEVSVKATIENIEIKMLKRFGMAEGPSVMKIIREEVGEELRKQNRDKEREYLVEKADDEELMGKVFLQCGVEDRCKNKDCLKCPRRERMSLSLTHAEKVVIEDFAMIDLKIMGETKPKELELMQKICYKIMRKIFREEREE